MKPPIFRCRVLGRVILHPSRYLKALWLRARLIYLRYLRRYRLVLIDRPSGLGDIICTLPAVREVQARQPNTLVIFLANRSFIPAVQMSGCVYHAIAAEADDMRVGDVRSYFDEVYTPLLDDERGVAPSGMHMVDQFAREMRVVVNSSPMLFPCNPHLRTIGNRLEHLRSNSGPLVGIHVGPTWAVKEWSRDGWEQLVELLIAEREATVVQFGVENGTSGGLRRSFRVAGAFDLVDRLRLEETIAGIACCDLFVGVDSGLLHVAGAVRTACVGVFGAVLPAHALARRSESAGVTANVPCVGCHHRNPCAHWRSGCPEDIRCMKELDAQAVFKACCSLLDATSDRRRRGADMHNVATNHI